MKCGWFMQESFDDPHKTAESPVVHVRGLAETVVEADLIEAVQPFGNVGYVAADLDFLNESMG